jgi:hypothetical protein
MTSVTDLLQGLNLSVRLSVDNSHHVAGKDMSVCVSVCMFVCRVCLHLLSVKGQAVIISVGLCSSRVVYAHDLVICGNGHHEDSCLLDVQL